MRKRIIVSLLLVMADGYAMERDVERVLAISAEAASAYEHPHYQPLSTTPSVPPLTLTVQMPEAGNPPRRVERGWLSSPEGVFLIGVVIGAYATFKTCVLTSMCNQ